MHPEKGSVFSSFDFCLLFRQARVKKLYDRPANLNFGKIRMGWIKQVIIDSV